MRKAIIFAAAAFLPLCVAMDASAASSGTFEFTVSTDTTVQETQKQKKKPKSFIALILQNVGWGDDTEQTFVVASIDSKDAAEDNKGCPEAKEQASAKPEGAEDGDEKTPVGPEPLYFAF